MEDRLLVFILRLSFFSGENLVYLDGCISRLGEKYTFGAPLLVGSSQELRLSPISRVGTCLHMVHIHRN